MDRREFFRRSVGKAAETVTRHVDKKVTEKAIRYIRPPFAIDELEFLLACTRCSDCIGACPHQVIFQLGTKLGAEVAGTPALDLLNKGCQLCNDWPCVNACETGALKLPEENSEKYIPVTKFANAEIDTAKCLPYAGPECGACAFSCAVEGALLWQEEKPVINQQHCVGCGMCREACIVEGKAINISSIYS